MEALQHLIYGLEVVLRPSNMLWITIGSVLGTILGMVPGLGPATGIALLLPLTFVLKPETALIAMAAIFFGAMFGGSRSSILLNIPGDASAVATCFDGYPMAMNGEAEAALAISAIASFIGGLLAAIGFVFLALPLAKIALMFGPPEYFALMVLALTATASLSEGKVLKGLLSMTIGLMISVIGLDPQSGVSRFTFGVLELQGGIDFIVVIMGVYGLGEVLKNLEKMAKKESNRSIQKKFKRIWITKEQWRRSVVPILRSAPLGFLIGILPGAGGTIAALMSYNVEKKLSKNPEKFGKGAIEGVAAPESANNACSIGAMIPALTLGIPGSGTAAVMLGALMIYGLQPGPLLFQQYPEIGWGIIAALFVGDIICAVINLPLAGLLVRVLAVPPKILYPLVAALCFIGVYAVNVSTVDFYLLIIFGLLGYAMRKFEIPTAPLILATVVGGKLEQSFRQSLMLSDGDFTIFFQSKISLVLILLTVFSLFYPFISKKIKSKRLGK
ncbi:MAG TPA: transporter [Pseudothermotoga sp.]|uniref:tripartite tricarboxylate transporter permease n=1 Tax=Pseudothermotoga lettingae TaxID=177758 RepID=UPI00074A331E|nr:tripartite tricarboxylate transporter permease [Pseudothermotoga lettingae]KUK21616.1 MAG: Membrane protein [Pseudothermotoga lettingae]HBT25368.1 transporter [Pseudothermotoga sp.]